jgi:hypothetical protein
MAPPRSAHRADMPRAIAHYYYDQLYARRFRLEAYDGVMPILPERPVRIARTALDRMPKAPALEALVASCRAEWFEGWIFPENTYGAHPALLGLAELGVWRLGTTRRGRSFGTLRELDLPMKMVPIWTRVELGAAGVERRLHGIPLRWHPGAVAVIAVTAATGRPVTYRAWVIRPPETPVIALYWSEAQRIIDLFRDMTASYFALRPSTAAEDIGGWAPAERGLAASVPDDEAHEATRDEERELVVV